MTTLRLPCHLEIDLDNGPFGPELETLVQIMRSNPEQFTSVDKIEFLASVMEMQHEGLKAAWGLADQAMDAAGWDTIPENHPAHGRNLTTGQVVFPS